MWIVSAARPVIVTVQSVSVVPGTVRSDAAAEAIIRREVAKPGVIYGQKVAAILAHELPWLLDCTILLNNAPSLPADTRSTEIREIKWTS
jgi:hypothetical protein